MANIMLKVVLVNPCIPHYRIPVFAMLGSLVDLTVLHSGEYVPGFESHFSQKIVNQKEILGVDFLLMRLGRFLREFDVVVSEGNIRHVDRNLLVCWPFRKYAWVFWTIGVSASYRHHFDSNKRLDRVRFIIFRQAESLVFYSEYPVKKYIENGFRARNLFVAHNTVEVGDYKDSTSADKEYLLFVGTLYGQKKIYSLLRAYEAALRESKSELSLLIVGDGPARPRIEQWIDDHDQRDRVKLLGSISEPQELTRIFRDAIACISPGQAGLSVLTSMGNGTPFVTHKNAITGGELFNIADGINGSLFSSENELKEIIIDIIHNKIKYIEMGRKARDHYRNNRSISEMVNSLYAAIERAHQRRSDRRF